MVATLGGGRLQGGPLLPALLAGVGARLDSPDALVRREFRAWCTELRCLDLAGSLYTNMTAPFLRTWLQLRLDSPDIVVRHVLPALLRQISSL